MLFTTPSFCQTTYPKVILWNNDTIVAISPSQLQSINVTIANYEALKKSYSINQSLLNTTDSINLLLQEKTRSYEAIIESTNTLKEDLEHSFQDYIKQTTIKEKRSRLITIGVGVGGTLIGTTLGVLLSK